LFLARIPQGYAASRPDKIGDYFRPALGWSAAKKHGGIGLIGEAGAGKSSAIACLLWTLEQPFVWWSGTEARDAAIEAATADKDREGANRRWEHAMRVPLLVVDDISQGKLTESWSSKLFDILETRLGSGLPTLWTSQIPIADIKAKIVRQNGGDVAQAEAITRRMSQHSLVLKS
jgi:DNA replication protein DnaC